MPKKLRHMRTLKRITPTAEQLPIISRTRTGLEVIRGAAGSGKTTTALLRLRSLVGFFASRRRRLGDTSPIRVAVLTYNRTLRGYISSLIDGEAENFRGVDLFVATFAQWARQSLGQVQIANEEEARQAIRALAITQGLDADFVSDEVDYVLGRFRPEEIETYATATRVGRGSNPRMPKASRQKLITDVINPYADWKAARGVMDWHDLAVALMARQPDQRLEIVIADETQDFSANQLRAIVHNLADVHSMTIVLDAAQRIYARGFTWAEVGLTLRPENAHRLSINYRNTKEIAKFAASIIAGLEVDDDASLPDFNSCERRGSRPRVLRGRYRDQLKYALNALNAINLNAESVAFFHPKGGGWFQGTRTALRENGFKFVEISRQSDWPAGDENIALSTLHSAKGLEFDHVFILGLNAETVSHGEEQDDDRLSMLRRLLAMGVGRAKLSVTIGYKPSEASRLIEFLNPDTFNEIDL